MTKHLQVYFHTEDEAEKLKATLNKFSATNILVDHLEEQDDGNLVVPYLPEDQASANMGNPGMSSHAVGYQDVERDDAPRNAIITFEVGEEDLNEVLIEIQKMNGHVDRSVFE